MLIMHEKRLFHRLRRDGDQRSPRLLDLGPDQVHRFHLPYAEWTPPPTNEANHQPPAVEQIRRANDVPIMILHFEGGGLRSDSQRTCRNTSNLQLGYGLFVNRLSLRWNVLRNQLLALGKNRA